MKQKFYYTKNEKKNTKLQKLKLKKIIKISKYIFHFIFLGEVRFLYLGYKRTKSFQKFYPIKYNLG